MKTNDLHAYIQGPNLAAVALWMREQTAAPQHKELVDLTVEIGSLILRYRSERETWELEQQVGSSWFELTIRPQTRDSTFTGWKDLTLGEHLVDALGGSALVSCGGIYTHPLSDQIVRITQDKMELVFLPSEVDEPIDETLTTFIKMR